MSKVFEEVKLPHLTLKNRLVRSATHLSRAEKILRHLHNEIDIFYKGYALNQDLLDLRNGTQTALLITYAALKNKQSIGCHYIK